jgi:RimJ/RimL family protein N-acetyltransferase
MRNPVLVGERVYLRPLEPDDADRISEFEAQENETITHMGGRTPMSPIALRKMISEEFKTMPPGTIEFAVCLKENDEMIGVVGVTDINWVHGHGETFSHLRPGEWRGQGFGTEAKHLLLEYCFDHIGLHVLTSWVWELNGRSAGALAKQGYKSAGRLKADGIEKGVYYDDMVFDLLRADWVEARDTWQASRRARTHG